MYFFTFRLARHRLLYSSCHTSILPSTMKTSLKGRRTLQQTGKSSSNSLKTNTTFTGLL